MPKTTLPRARRRVTQASAALTMTPDRMPRLRVSAPVTVSAAALSVRQLTRPTPLRAALQRYVGLRGMDSLPSLSAPDRFSVMSSDESQRDVALPLGVPRYVRAGLLKRLAGGRRGDSMLERKGEVWEFVSDDTRIDLTDGSRVFRVGLALLHS